MTSSDKLAAALIAFVGALIPVLQLSGAINLTSDGVAAVMLCVTQAVTLGGLLFQSVQHKTP